MTCGGFDTITKIRETKMKRLIGLIFIGLILQLACSSSTSKSTLPGGDPEYHFFKTLSKRIPILAPDKTTVLAKSSEFTLTAQDIFPAIYQEYGFFGPPPEKLDKGEIMNFIKNQIYQNSVRLTFASAAQKRGFSVPPDSIQKHLQELYTHFGGKEEAFNDLARQGLTLKNYKREFVNRKLYQDYVDNYLQKVVYKKITVSEDEIRQFYNNWASADFQLLTVSFAGKTPAGKDSAFRKINDILKKARAGKDFGELVKKYSDLDYKREEGGRLKDFPRTHLPDEIQKAIDETPVGAISDPFETTESEYMIIKVLKKMKESRPFEKAKPDIERYLTRTKKQALFTSTLDSLKKATHYKEMVQL